MSSQQEGTNASYDINSASNMWIKYGVGRHVVSSATEILSCLSVSVPRSGVVTTKQSPFVTKCIHPNSVSRVFKNSD